MNNNDNKDNKDELNNSRNNGELNGNGDNGTFCYTYSSERQREIEKIRSRYAEAEMSGMDKLIALDRSATRKGRVVSILLGIFGALTMGVGMCFAMVWSEPAEALFFVGVLVGLVGIAAVAVAYPVYSAITKRERARIAPEIIALSNELLK